MEKGHGKWYLRHKKSTKESTLRHEKLKRFYLSVAKVEILNRKTTFNNLPVFDYKGKQRINKFSTLMLTRKKS